MANVNHPSFHSLTRISLLGFLIAAQGFAGMPGPGFNGSWRGGFRGGYGYRGGYRGYGRFGGPRWGWGPGFWVPGLPLGFLTLSFGGAPWYYGDGYWYRPYGAGFVVDVPPVGLVIPALPADCSTVTYGGVPYYCANDVYYQAAPGGYRVIDPPAGKETKPAKPSIGSPDAYALEALVLIPKNGQSNEKIQADRQAAQRFASNQTGYDPANSDPTDPGTPRARKAFLNSMKSYMEARGYSAQ